MTDSLFFIAELLVEQATLSEEEVKFMIRLVATSHGRSAHFLLFRRPALNIMPPV